MLRLIHKQTNQGAILVDDIDDGLPNKTAHRLGSTSDPNSYARDGYANLPKQPSYVPLTKVGDASLAGYIDLKETPRVVLSAGKGKIYKLSQAGFIDVISFAASDLVAPEVYSATLDDPAAGDLTLSGSNFLSIEPNTTIVTFSGDGVGDVTLTLAEIEAVSPGSVTDTEIIIDSTLIAGLTLGDTIQVTSNDLESTAFVVLPTISGVTLDDPAAGDLTIAGLGFSSTLPLETMVYLVGDGVGDVTLSATEIEAVSPGSVTDTEIIIDSTLIAGLAPGDTIQIEAEGLLSEVYTIPI